MTRGQQEFDFYSESPVAGQSEQRVQEWFTMLLRGKWVILLCTALTLGAAAWYTSNTKPTYETAAVVLISQKSGKGANPFGEFMDVGPSSKLANELGILKTRTLAEAVAQSLLRKPYFDDERRELLPIVQAFKDGAPTGEVTTIAALSSRAKGSMEFLPERESDIIRIIARSTDPREAAILANTYALVYQEQTTLQSRSRTRSVREFLENRLTEQSDTLRRSEQQLRGFMESAGVTGLDQESNRVVQELSQLEATRNALDLDIQTEEKRLSSFQSELPQQESKATAAISQASDSYIRQLQEQLGRLEAQRDMIIAQNDPAILGQAMYQQRQKELDEQIATLRKRLEERSAQFIQSFLAGESVGPQSDALGYLRGLKQQMLETKFKLETLRSRRAALERTIGVYDARFRQIPRQSIELARLQRERLSSERLYTMVEERYNQAAITEKSEFGYVDIIDRAVIPYAPVSPNMQKNLLMGLLLGLGLGVGLVFLREMMDVRTRTPEQLRARGFLPLAEIAPMRKELAKLQKDGRLGRAVKNLDPSLWLIFDPLSMLAESYRRLRTTLLRAQLDNPWKIFMVTSASPSEGKTTTATNLALALAETQKRVILLDADIRRPRIHSLLGVSHKPGLSDYVQGKATLEEVTQTGIVEYLDFISSGSTAEQPSRIFASSEMMALVTTVKMRYDFMIIDVPPALVVNDASVLATAVDAVVLVANAGKTRVAALEKALEIMQASKGNVFGVVLNNFDPRKAYGGYYGSDRYGHYGHYKGYYTPDEGHGKKNGKKALKRENGSDEGKREREGGREKKDEVKELKEKKPEMKDEMKEKR